MSPLEPIIKTLEAMDSDRPFDFTAIDLISDRRPLSHLISFLLGDEKAFKFGCSVIGNTVLFTRIEAKGSREEIRPGQYKGYRMAMEEAYLKLPGFAKGSTSHHRLVTYKFGGLKFLVRFAVDGYLEDSTLSWRRQRRGNEGDDGVDDLASWTKALTLSEPKLMTKAGSAKTHLAVQRAGRLVPDNAVFELSTRHISRPIDMQVKLREFWIAQGQWFIEAFHHAPYQVSAAMKRRLERGLEKPFGTFKAIRQDNVKQAVLDWETQQQPALRALAALLQQILAKVRGSDCIVEYDGGEGGLLVIREIYAEADKELLIPKLPEELKKVFLRAT